MSEINTHVQHIKKKCPKSVFDLIDSGDKTFEVLLENNVRVDPGDLITEEEWDQERGEYTGRRITRKVSYTINTADYDLPADEIARHGITICSLVSPEHSTLRSVIAFSHIVSFVIYVKEIGDWTFLLGPNYVPPSTTPDLIGMGVLGGLKMERWLHGIYEVTLLVVRDEKRSEYAVMDHLITGMVAEDGQGVMSIELDYLGLINSKCNTTDGKAVELATYEEVTGSPFNSEEMSAVKLTSEFDASVESTLDSILAGEYDGQYQADTDEK